MERNADLRTLDEHVVFESVDAAAGFVVHGKPAVAGLERSPFSEPPVQAGNACHVKSEPAPNPPMSPRTLKLNFLPSGRLRFRAYNRIPPILGARWDARRGQDARPADFATEVVVTNTRERFEMLAHPITDGRLDHPLAKSDSFPPARQKDNNQPGSARMARRSS